MEQENRIKKEGIKRGARTQKAMAFRLDNDLADWMSLQANKGRYINDLIRADKARHEHWESLLETKKFMEYGN